MTPFPFKFWIAIILIMVLFVSCKPEPIRVKFSGYNEGVVRFDVENNTDRDIYSIDFEITCYSLDQSVIEIDTIKYQNTSNSEGEQVPFLKANETTFFGYATPKNTTSASARVLEFDSNPK